MGKSSGAGQHGPRPALAGRYLTLRRRADGMESSTFDVTGQSVREFERLWDGLVMKVDFEVWEPVYTPERGDDQTVAEWLR